ncbi:hypothetical protein SAMN05192534_10383 [Alteribacillus persepolensis]|uniref:Uncharacterized protein n=1 Tax=Alteribacillus persepolensis TaxID=568899 RepID=A0A1G8AZJ6_9BACI|nr:hypothetical protein SAMN05192534_10383 [Alteribacillus persepolensis]
MCGSYLRIIFSSLDFCPAICWFMLIANAGIRPYNDDYCLLQCKSMDLLHENGLTLGIYEKRRMFV